MGHPILVPTPAAFAVIVVVEIVGAPLNLAHSPFRVHAARPRVRDRPAVGAWATTTLGLFLATASD
jgi:hypothetical protein